MLTIYADNTVSYNHTHLGSVAQQQTATVFFSKDGQRYDLGKRIVLSAPDKSGWVELQNALIALGVIKDLP